MTATTAKTLSARFASVCNCGCGERYDAGTMIERGERGWQIAGHGQAWGTATPEQLAKIGEKATTALRGNDALGASFGKRYGELAGSGALSVEKADEILNWLDGRLATGATISTPTPTPAPKPRRRSSRPRKERASRAEVAAVRAVVGGPDTSTLGIEPVEPTSPLVDCSCGFLHRHDVPCL